MDSETRQCDSCARGSMVADAEYYCTDCRETLCQECKAYHSRSKASYTHVLKSVGESEIDMEVLDFVMELDTCSIHTGKKIKYVCEDHGELCCGECTFQKHRQCDGILSVTETETSSGYKAKLMTDKIKELESHADMLLSYGKEHMDALNSVRDNVKAKLAEMKRRIDQKFIELSRKTMAEVKRDHKEIFDHVLSNNTALEGLKDMMRNSLKNLEDVMTHGNETQLYVFIRQLEKAIPQYEEGIGNLQASLNCENIDIIAKEDMTEMNRWVTLRRTSSEPNLPQVPQARQQFQQSQFFSTYRGISSGKDRGYFDRL